MERVATHETNSGRKTSVATQNSMPLIVPGSHFCVCDCDVGRHEVAIFCVGMGRHVTIFIVDVVSHGTYKNVTEAHRENQGGHCERSEHGHPGFRGGPQCSRERGELTGVHFWCFQPSFMALLDHFSSFWAFFWRFKVLFGHHVKLSINFGSLSVM